MDDYEGWRGGRTGEDLGQFADGSEDLPDEAIGATERRVDLGSDADEAAGYRELELV